MSTAGTPSYHGAPLCNRPCQWSNVPSSLSSMRLWTVIWNVSPQLASRVGPNPSLATHSVLLRSVCRVLRTWKLVVDKDSRYLHSIGTDCSTRYCPVIVAG